MYLANELHPLPPNEMDGLPPIDMSAETADSVVPTSTTPSTAPPGKKPAVSGNIAS